MRKMRAAHDHRGARIAAVLACVLTACGSVRAQDASDTKQILERLDRLERQNAELIEEVRQLRQQLSGGKPADTQEIVEAQAVQQARIDEQAQSKVESAHKLPIRLTGMVLFNAFDFSHADGGLYGGVAPVNEGYRQVSGSLSQSILGLEYWDPDAVLGAKVHGALYMDFFGNASPSNPYAPGATSYYWWPEPRLRTGNISIDWPTTSLTAGVDKPLIAPLNPDSLAQVAVPALSGAGNLWLWQPQVRLEQRVALPDRNKLRLQGALYETRETWDYSAAQYGRVLEATRPGWEGRFAFEHEADEDTGFEIAPGFHYSRSHVAGQTAPSHIFSLDGRVAMSRLWNVSGTIFTGQNLAGVGGVGPGFVVEYSGLVRPVHGTGGWLQLTLAPTSRTTFHFFGGNQTNRSSDLEYNAVGSSTAYAGNVYYQLAPNVFAAFEAGQVRTNWTQSGKRLRNMYDLSLAYMF